MVFHSKVHRARLKNLRVTVDNEFCAVVLSSLDGQPISTSARMLLTAGGRAANTGMVWNDTRTALTTWGGGPSLIEPITGTIVLQNLAPAMEVHATALDGAGRGINASIAAADTEGRWTIALGKATTTWYEITVRRAGRR